MLSFTFVIVRTFGTKAKYLFPYVSVSLRLLYFCLVSPDQTLVGIVSANCRYIPIFLTQTIWQMAIYERPL